MKITGDMLETVQSINNMAAATGLTVQQVQVFTELAKEMDLDAGAVANSVSRLASQLGQYLIQGKSADEATQMFVKTANVLGVSIKDSTGNLRPIVDILGDFADKVNAIPDPATRSAVEIAALGIRAKVLADAFNIARLEGKSFKEVLAEIGNSDVIIKDKDVENLQKVKNLWDELGRSFRGLLQDAKTGIAKGFTSALFFSPTFGQLGEPGTGVSPTGTPTPATDVAKLQQALAIDKERTEEAKKRAEFEAKIWKEFSEQLFKTGKASGAPSFPSGSPSELIQRFLQYGTVYRSQVPIVAPDIGAGVGINAGPGITGSSQIPKNFDALLKQINDEHEDLFKTQYQKDAEYYQEQSQQLTQAYKERLISQQQYITASKELEADWGKTLTDLDKQYGEQAGALFEDLINGKTRQFSKTLTEDIKNIALAPIKNIFDQVVGGLFGSLARTINAPFQGTQNGGALGFLSGLPIIGGLFGAKTGGIGGGLGGIAPTGTPTNPIYVAPASGIGGIGGIGGGAGTPSFLGPIGNLPFTPQANALVNSIFNPSAASGSASGGGGIGSLLSAALHLGGPSGGFSLSTLLGAGGASGGFSLSKLFSAGGLGGAAASIGGGLLMGVGERQGGGLGALEGAAGGAAEGAIAGLAAGPLGAAVGAIIGGAIGGITAALGGPSFQQRVATSAWKQSYYAPPSETFSFASNGSISNTLGTGFAQSGDKFSQFGLPANTPFYASAITGPLSWQQKQLLQEEYANAGGNQPFGGFNTNPFAGQGPLGPKAGPAPTVQFNVTAIDSKGVSDFFNEHGDTISGILNSKSVYSSSSRFGASVRQAAFPP